MSTAVFSYSNILQALQRLGKSLMLPIAVLPVAGILLRFGSPDVLDIQFMKEAGAAIFGNLPLIFAIGLAVGLSKDNAGSAALAGAVGYLVMTGAMKTIDKSIDMGVLAGIISGITAGLLYNRFYQFRLPDWLAFFSGKRFVPIVTSGAVLVFALILGYAWPPIQSGIHALGEWVIESGPTGAFVYGTLNRLLIPTGLHQVINSMVWFVFGEYNGVQGDLSRFFAGDPTAGTFMAGYFPIMIFGLPAACLAMYRHAEPGQRKSAGGILVGVGLTSLVTGVTEPVEFLFMFMAPLLYLLHAVLTGISMAVCSMLGIKAGFTFSAGAIDLILNWNLGSELFWLIPICVATFVIYYGVFSICIRWFDLKTPGRQATDASSEKVADFSEFGLAKAYFRALGGQENVKTIDSCITRLRLSLVDQDLVDAQELKNLGAKGVVKLGKQGLQVIVGTQVERLCDQMKQVRNGVSDRNVTESKVKSVTRLPKSIKISAPINGDLIPLEQVPDEVFSEKMVGEGIAINPKDGKILAPCDGTIINIFATNHAFTILTESGAEILVHIGLDTVELQGKGFTRHVVQGQKVKRGDLVVSVDLDTLKNNRKSALTPVIVANSDQYHITTAKQSSVQAGSDTVFEVATLN